MSTLTDGQHLTDTGLATNTAGRAELHQNLLNGLFQNGDLTQAQFDGFSARLDSIVSTGNLDTLANSGMISSIGVEANYLAAVNNGIPVSHTDTIAYFGAKAFTDIASFLGNESGAVSLASFDDTMASFHSLGNTFSQIGNLLPDNLSGLGDSIVSSLANSTSSMIVGMGGGFIGDTAEFLNLSYDAIKTGLQTGDWTDFGIAVANYGASMVLTAAVVGVGTVVAAALFGTAGAALFGAAVAAYGVYDGWKNIAELMEKVLTDISALSEDNPEWLNDLAQILTPPPIDPLVVDLDGDGVELIALEDSAAFFDLDGDGFAEHTGWVAPDDGLLAVDRNGNGQIDDIAELLGSQTETGYQELAEFDTDGNGVVNAHDAGFGSLLIWRDLDGDGFADDGDLSTLAEAGISALSLNATATSGTISGNQVVETATVTLATGSITQSAEILFNLSQVRSSFILPEDFTFDFDAFALPALPGYGDIPDLWVAASLDESLVQGGRDLISTARTGDFDAFDEAFDDFLYDWAGVEGTMWLDEADLVSVFFLKDEEGVPRGYFFVEGEQVDTIGLAHSNLGAVAPWLEEKFNAQIPGWQDFLQEHGWTVLGADGSGDLVVEPPIISSGPVESDDPGYRDYLLLEYGEASSWYAALPSPGLNFDGSWSMVPFGAVDYVQDDIPMGGGLSAESFAFLQKIYGRDYRETPTSLAVDSLLVFGLEGNDAQLAGEAFDQLQDYMKARFYVGSAIAVARDEGPDADLGGLAPFLNLSINPWQDKVVGDWQGFVADLIDGFRANGYGTDRKALKLLQVFQTDAPYIGAIVGKEFPDIDRADIEQVFGISFDDQATNGDDVIGLVDGEVMFGLEGDDTISGSWGAQVLVGGLGNDVLNGMAGNDTYLYALGDGSDVIDDYQYSNISNGDELVLLGVASDEVTFAQNDAEDLIITLEDGATITIIDQLGQFYDRGMDTITLGDGVSLDVQGIRNKSVEDMKATGLVVGSDLIENYVYTDYDGSYRITDFDLDLHSGDDTLYFSDLTAGQVSFAHGTGDDLVITTSSGDVITVTTQFSGTFNASGIEQMIFADGTTLDRQGTRDKTVSDMKATGAVVGTDFAEHYTHAEGDGSYSIVDFDLDLQSGDDTFTFADLSVEQVTFAQGTSNDLIMTTMGGDVITLIDQFTGSFNASGVEQIAFADGTVLNKQGIRDKSAADMKATGLVVGSELLEHYNHAEGDGTYAIDDFDFQTHSANDTFTFPDLDADQVTFAQGTSKDLIMTTAGGDVITLVNQFTGSYGGSGVEQIIFADGTVLDKQGIRDKSASDMKATGEVLGSELVEHYEHGLGDGSYQITDYDFQSHSGNDTLTFTNVSEDEVVLTRSGNDLIIDLGSETVTLYRQFTGSWDGHGVEQIAFDDAEFVGKTAINAWVEEQLIEAAGHERALSMDGSGGLVIDPITLEGEFTVEGWIKLAPGSVAWNQDGFVSAGNGVTQDLNFYGGKLRLYAPASAGSADKIVSATSLQSDEWVHFAVTRSADGTLRIYRDGVLDAEAIGVFTDAFIVGSIGQTMAGSTDG